MVAQSYLELATKKPIKTLPEIVKAPFTFVVFPDFESISGLNF
jgi:hypothetical protein